MGQDYASNRLATRLWWVLGVLAVAIVIALLRVNISYYEISPGPTAPVNSLIQLPAAHRHRVEGRILLVTVYQAQAHPADFLFSWAHSNDQLVSSQELLGSTPASQLISIEQAEMQASQQAAEVVALRRLGYNVVERDLGAEVGYVVKGKPAARVVAPGDTIVAIDGAPVSGETAAAALLEKEAPGQTISLGVEAQSGTRRTVSVKLAARPGHPQQGFLGVGLFTRETFVLPFPVTIHSQSIGGRHGRRCRRGGPEDGVGGQLGGHSFPRARPGVRHGQGPRREPSQGGGGVQPGPGPGRHRPQRRGRGRAAARSTRPSLVFLSRWRPDAPIGR